MFRWRDVVVIWNLANFPSPPDLLWRGDQVCDGTVAADGFERDHIGCILRAGEAFQSGEMAQGFAQRVQGPKIQIAVAPLQDAHRIKVVVLELIDQFLLKWFSLAETPKVPSFM